MGDLQVRRLLVCDGSGRLVGVVSLGDIALDASEELPGQALVRSWSGADPAVLVLVNVIAALPSSQSHGQSIRHSMRCETSYFESLHLSPVL
ncbi:hypothetical protein [Palleronia sp.]|uniref:hypothetical protein n=1 Tax=Palleronia sp. TaxID=1940284 RepID=UPI0035C808A2